MNTSDVFRAELRDIGNKFKYWAHDFSAFGTFEAEETAGFWRFAGQPLLANACPFEFVVHPSHQADFFIGGETYEERPLASTDILQPMAAAIVAGRVITRRWSSSNTRLTKSVETIIYLENGVVWRDRHDNQAAGVIAADDLIKHDRHYPPYRRG